MPTQENAGTLDAMREAMIASIGRRTIGQFDCSTPISGLTFFRREAPMPPTICLVEACIVLVVQGEKQMLAGGEAYPYNINRFLITSLDIPANSQVVTASPDNPCLGLVLKLDLRTMAELIAQGGLPLPEERSSDRGPLSVLVPSRRCCLSRSSGCWIYWMSRVQSPSWRRSLKGKSTIAC